MKVQAAVFFGVVSGCAGADPGVDVHFDHHSDDPSLVAGTADAEDGRSISFEVSVNQEVPDLAFSADDGSPDLEVDVVFRDENGVPFLIQVGGHGLAHPEWFDEMSDGATGEDRSHLLELVGSVAAEAERLGVDASVLEALRMAAASADEDLRVVTGELPMFGTDELVSESAAPPATNYTHYVSRKKKGAFFGSSPADHSAIKVSIYNGSSFISSYYTCNHGTCASSSSMSTYQSNSYYAAGIVAPGEPCSTSYGFTRGKHVCNDDTFAQVNDIANGGFYTWSTCSDSTLRYWAP